MLNKDFDITSNFNLHQKLYLLMKYTININVSVEDLVLIVMFGGVINYSVTNITIVLENISYGCIRTY